MAEMSEYQTGSECRLALEKLMSDSEGTCQRALNYLFRLEQKAAKLETANALLQAVAEAAGVVYDWADEVYDVWPECLAELAYALDAYKEAKHG